MWSLIGHWWKYTSCERHLGVNSGYMNVDLDHNLWKRKVETVDWAGGKGRFRVVCSSWAHFAKNKQVQKKFMCAHAHENDTPHHPTISFLSVHMCLHVHFQRKMNSYVNQKAFLRMFIALLFTVDKTGIIQMFINRRMDKL